MWRHLQLIYQNPFTSLDPTWKVEQLVREPLDRFKIGTPKERVERIREALAEVGLGEHLLSRKPGALSGGQRQRVAIARSLVLKPDVIVLDEPTSALDVTVQADIIEVLLSLQANLGLTYLFVSHDLALVRQFAHTVSVMHRGRIVEHGAVTEIFDAYRGECDQLGSPASPDQLAIRRNISISRDADQAREEARAAKAATLKVVAGDPRVIDRTSSLLDAPRAGAGFTVHDDDYIAGTPAQVTEQLLQNLKILPQKNQSWLERLEFSPRPTPLAAN